MLFERAGKCKQCGKCCRHVYLRDEGKIVKSFNDCLEIAKNDTRLTQFNARGKNENGEIYFACDHIGRDGKCTTYYNRPLLCYTYPDITMLRYGAVPKPDCGYYFRNRFTKKKVM